MFCEQENNKTEVAMTTAKQQYGEMAQRRNGETATQQKNKTAKGRQREAKKKNLNNKTEKTNTAKVN